MSGFDLGPPRPTRRPSLTPMIDVVFLLLVFFMLAARFGQDMEIGAAMTGSGSGYSGPPRLITVTAEGVQLNGFAQTLEALPSAVRGLMETSGDLVVVRPVEGAEVQALVDVMATLRATDIANIAVVE